MNLPISENATVAADDITGRNACPIWLRVTAMMQAIPFEADKISAAFLEHIKEMTKASLSSKKLRIKKNSYPVWAIVRGVYYQFTSVTAFVRRIYGNIDDIRRIGSNAKQTANYAKKHGKDSFIYKGHIAYLKKPEGFGVPVIDMGA